MNCSLTVLVVFVIARCCRIYCRILPRLSYRHRSGVCEFPSLYQDKVVRQCQLSSDGLWWCPQDEQYDLHHQKIMCPNTTVTYAGSDPGKLCHMPFVYNGREHNACIKAVESTGGSVYWWCATTANYDNDRIKRWTRCKEQSDMLPCHFKETGGVGISAECRNFNNKWVCHTERSEIRECPQTELTYAGNSPGEHCHFPFLFGKAEYRSCISAKRTGSSLYGDDGQFESYLWCSTTPNYDDDRRWTKCVSGESSMYWRDRRVIIPVSVVLGLLLTMFCLAALLYYCCDASYNQKPDVSVSRPYLHISMRNIANGATPSAPPSYLEAVMSLHNEF